MKQITVLIFFLVTACHSNKSDVSLISNNEKAVIIVNGEPWEARAISGFEYLDMAEKAGVNTIRTWGLKHLDDGSLLDEAHRRGMKVLVGLWLNHHNQGIDYTSASDTAKIRQQYRRITEGLLKYKDHPAVLAWGVANEIDAKDAPVEVWDAVNDIAKFIHLHDSLHPTLTILASSNVQRIKNVKRYAPEIDILGVNSYRDIKNVRKNIEEAQWRKPYMVTEMGPDGFWEADTTSWGVPIESNSQVAAQMYIERYKEVEKDPLCIAIFPFKWGAAPKKTPTWLSIFTVDSAKTQAYDELFYLWNGVYPENRAPIVNQLQINGSSAEESIILSKNSIANASVNAIDSEDDILTFNWEILSEIEIKKNIQGSQKVKEKPIEKLLPNINNNVIEFKAPHIPGKYRLYVYVRDGNSSLGYANAPFLVIE